MCITISFFSYDCSSFITTPIIASLKKGSCISKYSIFAFQDSGDNQGSSSNDKRPRPKRRSTSSKKNLSRNMNGSSRVNFSSIFTTQLNAPPLIPCSLEQEETTSIIKSSTQHEHINSITGHLPVTYTNDPKTLEKWLMDHCSSYQDSEYSLLGFDVESAPNLPWRKPLNSHFIGRPASVQLSTPYSSIVVHLTWTPEVINHDNKSILSPLSAMLSDETIIKVGAGIDEDMLELYRWDQCLDAKSRFAIGGIGSSKSQPAGLKKQIKKFLGVELQKSNKIAMSDWSQIPLTDKQIYYASRDAWAGAALMHVLPNMCNGDCMQLNSIVSLMRGRERSMADVDVRARVRKEVKGQMMRMKERDDDPLIQIMPEKAIKKEINRLRKILAETAPDGCMYFSMDDLGLDFSPELQ